jgi:putative protein-disulfide isomerase
MPMILTLIFALLMTIQPKPKLIYVGDPMCSWCYGISPEMKKVKAHFRETADFEIIMGGLRPYNTQTMTDLKGFLTHHWEDVHKRSGQPFQYGILDNATITYDTEPPCRATVIVRSMDKEKAFPFFTKVQKTFYQENKNMHLAESYHDALKSLNLDVDAFDQQFHSDEMKTLVKEDFERSRQMGVQGFPSLVLQKGDQLILIANGYSTSEKMIEKIKKVLNK